MIRTMLLYGYACALLAGILFSGHYVYQQLLRGKPSRIAQKYGLILPGSAITEDDEVLIGSSLVGSCVQNNRKEAGPKNWGVEQLALFIDQRLSSTEQRMRRYVDNRVSGERLDEETNNAAGENLDSIIDREVSRQLARRSKHKKRKNSRRQSKGRLKELLLDLIEDDEY